MRDDVDAERRFAATLRATSVRYARAERDLWLVTWTAYNRWVPEVMLRSGDLEVSLLAAAVELEGAVRTAVYRTDPLLWATIESWAVEREDASAAPLP